MMAWITGFLFYESLSYNRAFNLPPTYPLPRSDHGAEKNWEPEHDGKPFAAH